MNEQNAHEGINRRTFLCSSAAIGAGLAFSPIVLAEPDSRKKPDDIHVALLGAGAQGRILVNSCLKIPGVRFKAVCDIWEAYNLKRVSYGLNKYGVEHHTYVDYRKMLDKEKDLGAVIIATPDFWHAKHTVDCLDAGLHVYCEVAMSNTIEGARKMVEAARETGKLLQIGHQRRSNPRYLHCYEKLLKEDKFLGRIVAVSSQWNTIAQEPLGWPQRAILDPAILKKYGYASMAQFRNWRWYKGLGGGPAVSHGSHQIDVINWFLEATPSLVMASGHTAYLDKKTHEWCDTVMAVFEYETRQGPVSAYYQILSSNRNDGYFEKFMGDKGTLVISEPSYRNAFHPELMNSTLKDWVELVKKGHLICPEIKQRMDELTTDQLAELLVVKETPPGWRVRDLKLPAETNKPYHQPHMENFFDAIRGQAALNCPAEVGYKTAVAVLKINDAIKAGRKQRFGSNEFVVYNPDKKSIEHIIGAKLPESARNCRYHSKGAMGSGTCWAYFEISRADLPALLNSTDHLPGISELGQEPGIKFNIEQYLERTGESLTWWKPLTLQKRRYAQKILGGENVTNRFQLIMLPAMDFCVGEIREDWLGVYLVYHYG